MEDYKVMVNCEHMTPKCSNMIKSDGAFLWNPPKLSYIAQCHPGIALVNCVSAPGQSPDSDCLAMAFDWSVA